MAQIYGTVIVHHKGMPGKLKMLFLVDNYRLRYASHNEM